VSSLVLSGQVGADKKNLQSFQCGGYRFSASDRQKSNSCANLRSSPPSRSPSSSSSSSTTTPTMVFKKVEVQMGGVSSDDDIRVRICDNNKCCTSKVLSNLLSGEWVAKKKETWDGGKLGNCSQILFDDKLATIEVSLLKDGSRAGPDVESLVVTGQVGKDKKKTQSFRCGRYSFAASDRQKTNFCTKTLSGLRTTTKTTTKRTTPRPASSSSSMVFKKIEVQMGAVGSDDDIRMKLCDRSKCCTTKVLSNLLSGEWRAKKKETWDGSKLGNCSQILFDDKLSRVEVSLLKDGKRAGPEVSSLVLSGQVGADKKNLQSFQCGGYRFSASDRQKSNSCANLRSSPPSRSPSSSSSSSTTTPTMVFKKVEVQMGGVSSDDDIRVRICDNNKCCTSKVLSNLLSGEWRAKKKETWDGSKLGNCSQILFADSLSSIEASILKDGNRAGPEVVSINLTGQIGSDKKNIKVYKCGSYKLSARDNQKSGFCLSNSPARSPSLSSSYSVSKITVQVGDDGTNDDVSLEICNKKSSINCCNTGKLDKSLSDDWSKNDLEVWEKNKVGGCKNETFDACKGFDVAIKKGPGKDSLKVSSITLEVADTQNNNNKKNFVCSDYNVGATDTVRRRTCSLDSKSSLSCPKPLGTGTNPRVPSPTPGPRPSKLPSAKPPTARPRPPPSTSGGDESVRIESFMVKMGSDGTSDPVTIQVCSDTEDVDVCCETPVLNQAGTTNWGQNVDDTWPSITLGRCSGQSLPTKPYTTVTNLLESKLQLTVNKKGKDKMIIDKFFIETVNNQGAKRRFKCPKFRVDREKATQECYVQFAKPRPATTPRTGPCLRSGRNCPSSTTTRPPFRSGSG